MPDVFVTRNIPEAGLRLLRERLSVEVWEEELPPSRDTLLARAGRCRGLLSLLTDRIDQELLDACPGLEVVSNYAVGYDNIDVEAATRRGVLITNTPGVLTEATADLAFALLLAAARRLGEGERHVRAGDWRTWHPRLLLGQPVWGATAGIIGLGRIGEAMARRCRGFAMEVLYSSHSRRPELEQELGLKPATREEIFERSDFVSLHVPLNHETRHLVNAHTLRQMKPSAVLVNTSRGGVVDETALVDALRTGQIAGAGLDVTDPEPPVPDHPLLELENAVVVPHIGSATHAARETMARVAAENLLAALEGKLPAHPVNPEAWG